MLSRFLRMRFLVALSVFAFSLNALAQHIVKTVQVGNEPRGVAVNPITDSAYVANVQDGTVTVLRHNSVTSTVPVDTLPFVVGVDITTNRIYAAGCNFFTGAGSMVVVIDGRTNKVITDVPLNDFCSLGTQGIAVNPITHRVYVSDYDENQEVVLDGSTNQIAARVDLQGQEPVGVAVDVRSNQVWAALDGPTGRIDILDGATNTLTGTISVGNVFVNDVAINPVTRRVYVTSQDSPSHLFVINEQTQQVITSVLIGTFANSVDVDPLTNLIFVTDAQENILAVVDGRTNTVTGTATLTVPFPAGVAVNPVTQRVYVPGFNSNMMNILTER